MSDDDKVVDNDEPDNDEPDSDEPLDDNPSVDAHERAAQSETAPDSKAHPTPVRTHKVRRWGLTALVLVLLLPALIFGAWAWVTLNYSYSKGDRAGYVQKLSRKGWLCKTWEGELAMVNLPGAMPEIFRFSVRNDSIAHVLQKNIGKRVSIAYEQHRGVPTSCFAETQYYITNVRLADQ
jgi:hypothetical protein